MTGKNWIFITAAIVLAAVLFYFSGIHKPSPEPIQYAHENHPANIVAEINEGNLLPMEGIRMLLDIVEKDSNDIDANYQLGILSIQSGQYAKALKRLEKVRSFNTDYIFALYLQGIAYMNLGNNEPAVDCFNEYIKRANDHESIDQARKYIEEIRAL